MRPLARARSLGVLVLALAVTGYARADDAPVTAEAMIARGIELRKSHEDAEALIWFDRALAAEPSPRARAHAALARQALGRWTEADAGLRAALAAGDDAWIARHRAELESALRIVGEHLGWIQIECDAPGASLYVDGEHITDLPRPDALRVTSGPHDVLVRAPGFRDATRAIAIAPGEHFRERVSLLVDGVEPLAQRHEGADATGAPVEPARVSRGSSQRAIGYTVGGLGLAAIAVGAVFGVEAIATKQERDKHCQPDGSGCDPYGVQLDTNGRTQATIATIAIAAGGVGLGAGTYLLLTVPSATQRRAANVSGVAVVGVW